MTFALTIKTAAELAAQAQAQARAAIDARIEDQARALGYNSAAHLAGYAASTVPQWAAEAQAFVAWRDAVWLATFDAETTAIAAKALPDPAKLLAALPVWGQTRG